MGEMSRRPVGGAPTRVCARCVASGGAALRPAVSQQPHGARVGPPYRETVTRLALPLRLFLVLVTAASTQGLLLAQGAWLVNQEWIANTLCVNRDRPELNCDGKCQLADRMKHMSEMPGTHVHEAGEDHDHDHPDPAALLELAMSVRAPVAERLGLPVPPARAESGPAVGLHLDTGREVSLGVFHPPRTERLA